MKKILLYVFILTFCVVPLAQADEVERLWWASSATGGGSGSMDGAISGVSINANDGCIVINGGKKGFIYKAFVDSAAEYTVDDIPIVVAPDDVGAGGTRWHLVDLYADRVLFRSGTTLPILSEVLGGASTYGIHEDIVLTSEHLTGRVGEIMAATAPIVELPTLSSGVTGIAILTDITTAGNDSGVTVWSQSTIYEGTGTGMTSGQTFFINGAGVSSGATGFTLTIKETSIGWKVWGTDATILRPSE